MDTKKNVVSGMLIPLALVAMPSLSSAEQKILSAAEVKALITGKTVSVTFKKNGKQWKMYFSPEGKSFRDNGKEGEWKVTDEGQHCITGIKFKCAKVADLGDGTYARLKSNGKPSVIWTKIEDGKHL